MRVAGHAGRVSHTKGTRHTMPSAKRMLRKVSGDACCRAILLAMKPLPQIATKYQARSVLLKRGRRDTEFIANNFCKNKRFSIPRLKCAR